MICRKCPPWRPKIAAGWCTFVRLRPQCILARKHKKLAGRGIPWRLITRYARPSMTDAFIKYYYGTALAACLLIAGEMAVLEYRGLILPPPLMCLALGALAGVLLG